MDSPHKELTRGEIPNAGTDRERYKLDTKQLWGPQLVDIPSVLSTVDPCNVFSGDIPSVRFISSLTIDRYTIGSLPRQ